MTDIKCPSCGHSLTEHYQTIYTCDNVDCLMYHAILSKEQWLYIVELANNQAYYDE